VAIFIRNHLLIDSDFEDNPWVDEQVPEQNLDNATGHLNSDDQDDFNFNEEEQLQLALQLSLMPLDANDKIN